MSENPQPAIREDAGWSRSEIDAAIAGLDQATRAFSAQVEAIGGLGGGDRAGDPTPYRDVAAAPEDHGAIEGRMAHPPGRRPIPPERQPSPPDAHGEADRSPIARIDPETAFEAQMREAEREAEEYLSRAKRRADSLVNSMIGAVEREAAEIRADAERGIRERWRAVEAEAGRFLGDAKRVADNMVAERQERIGELSDGITGRAEALTRGMEDAERIRRQFDGFVRALARTADQIADQAGGSVDADITRLQHGRAAAPRRTADAA